MTLRTAATAYINNILIFPKCFSLTFIQRFSMENDPSKVFYRNSKCFIDANTSNSNEAFDASVRNIKKDKKS